ncbi:hypothetical protein BDN67DRAFT_984049 [Paxillus ammoniavirescens]|nr:hypothetical protein BDN67DRAFT_984049 [Paxillus ammoniavirescens]
MTSILFWGLVEAFGVATISSGVCSRGSTSQNAGVWSALTTRCLTNPSNTQVLGEHGSALTICFLTTPLNTQVSGGHVLLTCFRDGEMNSGDSRWTLVEAWVVGALLCFLGVMGAEPLVWGASWELMEWSHSSGMPECDTFRQQRNCGQTENDGSRRLEIMKEFMSLVVKKECISESRSEEKDVSIESLCMLIIVGVDWITGFCRKLKRKAASLLSESESSQLAEMLAPSANPGSDVNDKTIEEKGKGQLTLLHRKWELDGIPMEQAFLECI